MGAAVIAAILTACQAGEKISVSQAQVERSESGTYEISWTGMHGPVDVYVANRPDSPREAMHLLVDNDLDGRASIRLATTERPYFYVAADRGSGLWTAERFLPLQGGLNFRDLGGDTTVDGRRIRWGRLYRSGSMASLTTADYGYLSHLGISVVCDLQTHRERNAAPNKWVMDHGITYWKRDYELSSDVLVDLMSRGEVTHSQVEALLVESYREMPYEQAPAYREIFKRLAAGEIPLAFNCAGGKDRTGVAAALILSALGVQRDTIIADYALSAKAAPSQANLKESLLWKEALGPLANMPMEVLAPLGASDPAYIRAAFAAIEQRNGTVENYLRQELRLTGSELNAIREQLLQ